MFPAYHMMSYAMVYNDFLTRCYDPPRLTSQQVFFAPGIRAHIVILALAENVSMRCLKEFTHALDHEAHRFDARSNYFASRLFVSLFVTHLAYEK